MERNVSDGLVLVGFGLLVSFVGLVWVANLFGVADEHARRITKSSWTRMIARRAREDQPTYDPKNYPGMRLGRYIAGFGTMLVGVLAIAGGVARVITG